MLTELIYSSRRFHMPIQLHPLYCHTLHSEWVKDAIKLIEILDYIDRFNDDGICVFFFCFYLSYSGIGTLDVALVPLLASIVDSKYTYGDDDDSAISSYGSPYGGIYTIQQIRLNFTNKFGFRIDFHLLGIRRKILTNSL